MSQGSVAVRGGLKLEGLVKRFDDVAAVAGIDLELPPGKLISFLGPSGCGKTTLLRMIAGLEHPTEGRIFLDDDDITDRPAYTRDIGMVFQSLALFPHLNVAGNVGYGLRIRGAEKERISSRVAELLTLVSLEGMGDRRIQQLSGGQRQRVATARALALEPRLFLLDEPLSALDARVRVQLRDEIRRVQLAEGITTLFVTHDQSEALAVADRVAVLNAGRLEQVDVPQIVYAHPATPFVAEFVGVMNTVPVAHGRITPGAAEQAQIRPEALRVGAQEGISGTVLTSTFLGAVTRLVVTTEVGELTVDAVSHPDLPGIGDTTTVGVA
jgi:putative spermidine/putrescine transport system ATP-binding protein